MQLFKDYINTKRLKKLRKNRKINVGTLTVQHFLQMSDIVEKYAEELDIESVTRLISSLNTESKPEADESSVSKQVVALGVDILKKVSSIGKTDVLEFFAALICVTPEEFKEMPIDTPLIIIDQIRTSPEAEGFFIMQSLGSKLTGLFDKPIEMLKELYASTSEETTEDS